MYDDCDCQRMRASGYNENYRLQILRAGMTGYDKMVEVERGGGRPVNQPRSWDADNRQKKKGLQGKLWFRRGGFDVPLFVPCTPKGELAKRIAEVEMLNNQGRTVRFKVVEKRGVTLEEKLRRSNPWKDEVCGRTNCFPCQSGDGGNCWREGVTYSLICEECGRGGWLSILESLEEMLSRGVRSTC